MFVKRIVSALLMCFAASVTLAQIPSLVEQDGRHALLVDGEPYLILGAQMHNSSAWPETLAGVWQSAAYLHANTVEAPVYWEQLEEKPGQFDFTNVDALVVQAREHRLHLVLLWFGTWKNARGHYTPEWIKLDTRRFPRLMDANGRLTDSMSPFGKETLDADRTAFAALMSHLKKIDGQDHTVLMVQVENEAGSLDSVRDYSPEAERQFKANIPESLVRALHLPSGSWESVFGTAAAEKFQAYSVASYIDKVAEAGKAEYPLPMYVNVWVRSPDDLEPEPPRSYPSGGAVDTVLDLWKATVHSIDMISPDVYSGGDINYRRIVSPYNRPDNALFVPENSHDPQFARYVFSVLGQGGVGFSVWGMDKTNFDSPIDPLKNPSFEELAGFSRTFLLLGSMDRQLAALNFRGQLQTALEGDSPQSHRMTFGKWQAVASFGYRDEGEPLGVAGPHGVLLAAQIAPDEFLVTGYDAHIEFHLANSGPQERWQILRVEEGSYRDGEWKVRRWLNGDECDFGVNFGAASQIVHIRMGRY
jgi:hypothetical protein